MFLSKVGLHIMYSTRRVICVVPSCKIKAIVHNFQGFFVTPPHCQKLGTRWQLRVRTKAIMAANSYKKMYGDKETCSNISVMSLRIFDARLETC